MRFGLAFKAFFAALSSNDETAKRIEAALQVATPTAERLPSPESKTATPPPSAKPVAPARNDALTLLSTLQREARFIDLVKEPLDQYGDAQVGAAARDVLRDCAKTLDRLFQLRPLIDQNEGSSVTLPSSPSPLRYRITGKTGDNSNATLVHHGWTATTCQVPQWTGGADDALVVAAAEVEA